MHINLTFFSPLPATGLWCVLPACANTMSSLSAQTNRASGDRKIGGTFLCNDLKNMVSEACRWLECTYLVRIGAENEREIPYDGYNRLQNREGQCSSWALHSIGRNCSWYEICIICLTFTAWAKARPICGYSMDAIGTICQKRSYTQGRDLSHVKILRM